MEETRRFAKAEIVRDVTTYTSISGKFEAEHYRGEPQPLDTNVDMKLDHFCISWVNREKFMDEIAEVIKKYII